MDLGDLRVASAVNVEFIGSSAIVTSRNSKNWPEIGFIHLNTASLTHHNSVKPSSDEEADMASASSRGVPIRGARFLGTRPRGSESIPIPLTAFRHATAAAARPEQCVMLPTILVGHIGPRPSRSTGSARWPSFIMAARAQARPRRKSSNRIGATVASTASSSARSGRSGAPNRSSTTSLTVDVASRERARSNVNTTLTHRLVRIALHRVHLRSCRLLDRPRRPRPIRPTLRRSKPQTPPLRRS